MTQASESVRLTIKNGVFHSKAGFVSGTPIFVGTRVPSRDQTPAFKASLKSPHH